MTSDVAKLLLERGTCPECYFGCFDHDLSCGRRGVATFTSGAKSSEAKPRYDLIPVEALTREALRMAEGAAAHGENNYRVGVQDEQFIKDRINHMLEHALLYAAGDRSTDHLAGVRCNAGMLIWLEAQK